MVRIKALIHILLFLSVSFLVGCMKDSTKGSSAPNSPQVVNRLIGNNFTSADFPSKTQSLITLSYTSLDSDLGTACSISQIANVSVTQACSCDGMGVCVVGVTGTLAYTGSASFAFNITAGGKTSTTGRASFNILAPLPGSNVTPTISAIAAKSTNEGVAVSSIQFSVADSDSVVNCSNVVATSSNTTLLPVANITITGTTPNCYVAAAPVANTYGSSNIVLTLTDTGSPLPAKTATSSFTLTVNGFNDPPVISAISAQALNEDVASSAIAFTVSDSDSTITCASVNAVSSNTTVISSGNIVIAGTAPNCTATITPNLNQSGASTITLTLTDNGMPLPAKSVTSVFTATVAAVNDAPVLSTIANQTTAENVAKAVAFTISDIDSTVTCAGSVAITSSNTTLVPNSNIVVTGTAPNCSASVTPANNLWGTTTLTLVLTDSGTPMPAATATRVFTFDVTQANIAPTISAITGKSTNEDTATAGIAFTIADSDSTIYCSSVAGTSSNTTLIPNGNIVITGTAPNCIATISPAANLSGTATITLTLTDNGTPMPALTATSSFLLTVNAVNDVPVLSTITTQTTNENVAKAVAFTISDVDSTVTCAGSVAITSSNTTLVPNGNIVVTGTAPNCSASVTPATNQYGSTNLTVLLTDNGTPMPAATATKTFTFDVTQVNIAPTISAISAKSTNEDTATSAIAFTIADSDSTIFCTNVAGTSSNTTLIPNGNIVITGTAPNCVATMTPVANLSGMATITLTLTDTGTPMPAMTATSSFVLTVNPINDAPTISAITSKSTDEDVASSAITFTIADIDSTITCAGSVSAVSSNTTVIPNANIVISGSAPNCQAVITSAANKNGSATITLTVTDNGTPMPALTATSAFTMTIDAVPDLTGSLTVANNLSGVASSYSGNSYARKLSFSGLTSDEALTSVEVCLGTTSGGCDVSSWVVGTGYTTSGTAPTITLGGSYRLKSGIGGAQVFTLAASCSSTTNYYYSVRGTNSISKLSNVISTPAWNFWEPTCLGASILTQWLDASEPGTITIASGVSGWTDKSGNNRGVTQSTASDQPAYSASGLGAGLPGLVFDGVNSNLGRASFIYAQGSASIFTVVNGTAIGANKYLICEGRNTGGSSNYYSPMATSTSNDITIRIIADGGTDLSLPATDAVLFDGTIRLAMSVDTGSSFTSYSNGTAQTQSAYAYTRTTNTINTYRLGARYRGNTESNFINATIGEFIVTYGVLTSTQRQQLEGYSAHKWNVNGNLQVAHPYSVSPP